MSEVAATWSHSCHLKTNLDETRHLLTATAEAWGGSFRDDERGEAEGNLVIPVLAGVRRGFVGGPVRIEKEETGSQVFFLVEESQYRVDLPAALTLFSGACGALIVLVAPFFPRLWSLVPIGVMLSVGTWLFIVARLRNSGPEEFFEELQANETPPRE
jgi:hypothetical protein